MRLSKQTVLLWDGQRRFLDTPPGLVDGYTGILEGLSIRLDAFGPEGRLAFRMHGGVAPLSQMRQEKVIGNVAVLSPRRNPDAFKAEYLEDAVRIVLAPLDRKASAAR